MVMNLNDYFDPVSLEKPLLEVLPAHIRLSGQIQIHTPNQPIANLEKFRVALMGVPEDRNSPNRGTAEAPDRIREELYQLSRFPRKLDIIDLGNLKRGQSINDTYAGLTDVLIELLSRKITAVVIGGSQDLTLAAFRAFKKQDMPCSLAVLDARLDLLPAQDEEGMESLCFLRRLIRERGKYLFQCTCLGIQQYLNDKTAIDYLEKLHFEPIRLGQIRSGISLTEPPLRDADIVSIDLGSVRFSDAPATLLPSPNGFYGDELCQMARYAGFGSKTAVFGLFEMNPAHDQRNISSQLAAQAIWYFLEGLSQKKYENPLQKNGRFRKFIVTLDEIPGELIFYKSLATSRWWIEVPPASPQLPVSIALACSEEDYDFACKRQITDRVWRIYRKML